MFGAGASVYSKVGLETDILTADPHRLVLILFDGALLCMARARAGVQAGDIAARNRSLVKAVQIVDEGLRVAVDPTPDPEFAGRLVSLYQYVVMRLLQANLRGDSAALDEAEKIMAGLRRAWAQIGPQVSPAAQRTVPMPDPGRPQSTPSATPASRVRHAYQA